MRWLGFLAIAVLVIACTGGGVSEPSIGSSSPEPSPAATAPAVTAPVEETPPPGLPSPWTPDIEPALHDRTGLAIELTPVAPPVPFVEGLLVEGPENRNVLLSWYGSPCELEPTLIVDGSAEQLTLTVYRGPIAPGECPASQPHRTLRLGLTTAVDPTAVTFSVRDGSPSE